MKTTPFKSLFLVRFGLVWHNLHDLHNLGLYEGFHFMKRVRGCPGKGYSKILNRGALLMTYPCQGRVLGKDRVFPLVYCILSIVSYYFIEVILFSQYLTM